MTAILVVPPALWIGVTSDLLATPERERAGVGFAGIVKTASETRLLLREWDSVPAQEYLQQRADHLEVCPSFWARHAKRARASGEALVIAHSHPRAAGQPRFSPSDDAGESTLVTKIHSRAQVPVAAAVVGPEGAEARLRIPGSNSPIDLAVRTDLGSQPDNDASDRRTARRFDRQVRALGASAQAHLADLTIAVVGLGGVGSHVVQQLAHLGVGRLIVVDPDRIDRSNLSRVVGATWWDATLRRRKTSIAVRSSHRIGGPTTVDAIYGSVTDAHVVQQLGRCDVIIGCTDTQWSRTILNAIAFQYYIPVLDLGVELQTKGSLGGRVSWLRPGSGCLWCQGILDRDQVRVEQLPATLRRVEERRGYIDGLDAPAPAVVSINGVIASLAVTELLAAYSSFAGPPAERPSTLVYRLADGTVRRVAPRKQDACPTCSPVGLLGLGDLASPTR